MITGLQRAADFAVPVFVVSSMALAGLRLRGADLVGALRQPLLLIGVLAANFVAAPALAYVIVHFFSLHIDHETALLLFGCAAGAPFLPKLAQLADGDVVCSVGLMLLLTVGTIVFMPVTLPLLVPGLNAGAWQIGRPLLISMLAPLGVGFLLRCFAPVWASVAEPFVARVANVSLVAAVALLILTNLKAMAGTVGSGLSLATVLMVASMSAVGYASAWGPPRVRIAAALAAGQRNVAAALVIATAEFPGPGVALAIVTATFAGLAPLLVAAVLFRRWRSLRGNITPLGETP